MGEMSPKIEDNPWVFMQVLSPTNMGEMSPKIEDNPWVFMQVLSPTNMGEMSPKIEGTRGFPYLQYNQSHPSLSPKNEIYCR